MIHNASCSVAILAQFNFSIQASVCTLGCLECSWSLEHGKAHTQSLGSHTDLCGFDSIDPASVPSTLHICTHNAAHLALSCHIIACALAEASLPMSCGCLCSTCSPVEQGEELHNVEGRVFRRCSCTRCGRMERGKVQCHARIPTPTDGSQGATLCWVCWRGCQTEQSMQNTQDSGPQGAEAVPQGAEPVANQRKRERHPISLQSRERHPISLRAREDPPPATWEAFHAVFGPLRLSEISSGSED